VDCIFKDNFIKQKMIFFILAILFFLFFTGSSYAYLDPATGTFIIQALIAIISSICTIIVLFYKKCIRFLKKIISKFKKIFSNLAK